MNIENTQSNFQENTACKNSFNMGWNEVALLFGSFIIGQIFVGLFLVIFKFLLHINVEKTPWFMGFSYFFVMAIPIFIFYVIKLKSKKNSFSFSFKNFTLPNLFVAFGMMAGMILVSEFLVSLIPISGSFFGPIYESFSKQMENISSSTVSMIITTVIFAPILEEILFRGIILKGMLNQGTNPTKAIVISALVFGAIHGYPWQAVGATLLGLVLGWVYCKTNSLVIPILLHAFNNGMASFIITKYDTESFADTFQVSELILFLVGLVLLSVSGYLFSKLSTNDK